MPVTMDKCLPVFCINSVSPSHSSNTEIWWDKKLLKHTHYPRLGLPMFEKNGTKEEIIEIRDESFKGIKC
jgi:hypothetical protein